MSVLAESMEPSKSFGDNPFDLSDVDNDTFMDLGLGPELVDPQLTMLCPGQHRDKPPDPFAMNSSFIWDTPLDGTMSLFESAVAVQEHGPDMVSPDEPLESSVSPSSATNLSSRRTSKASRTSSKSSVPSLSSTSQTSKKRVRKPSRKKSEQQPGAASPVQTTTRILQQIKREPSSGGEEDPKRTKYLERNRVAASKCRQKKKEWVHELEETKAEMEKKHVDLQQEYTSLLDEVTMIKNLLMRHAACKDPNIDQWIDLEAKKFVQKSTHGPDGSARRLSGSHSVPQSAPVSASASRRQSLVESMNPISPAPSPGQVEASPIIKMEEINYDHMPDALFA